MSKWQNYANRHGVWIGDMLNGTMRETLKAGVHTLVESTHMDSGRAANHWVVIPNRGSVRPGSWKQMTFSPAHNQPPVGSPGDGGSNRPEVIKAVVEREWTRAITKSIKGRTGQATVFLFHSSVPAYFDDRTGLEGGEATGESSYRENAKLEEAKQNAMSRMEQKFRNAFASNKLRKNPLR